MYNKILLISSLKKIRPNIKKKITDNIDVITYTYTLSLAMVIIQTLYIFFTKKKINYKEYKNKPKILFYLIVIATLLTFSSYIYNSLIQKESINKFTPYIYGADLVMLLVFALFFKDIKSITYNHILGLLLFMLGIYYYNKEGSALISIQK